MENAILPLVLGVAVVVVLGIGLLVLARRWSDVPARTGCMPVAPPTRERLSVDEIHALLARGHKIQAIKRVREVTGMGLKEAKNCVEALPHAPPLHEHMPVRQAPLNLDVEQEVRRLRNLDGKFAAIRRVRELTGMGLKEAKDYVDSL